MIKVKLKGKEKVIRQLERMARAYKDAVSAALYQEGLAIDADAVQHVPVDTGRLRASHYVTPPQRRADGSEVVEVGYGVYYGPYVHERTELHHEVGEAKWLENAVNRARPGYAARLLARSRQNVRTGVGVEAIPADAPERPTDEG